MKAELLQVRIGKQSAGNTHADSAAAKMMVQTSSDHLIAHIAGGQNIRIAVELEACTAWIDLTPDQAIRLTAAMNNALRKIDTELKRANR